MKRFFAVTLSIMLLVSVLASCSSNTDIPGSTISNTAVDNKVLYKVAIERYFNAYIKADLDTVLDSLDPDGPLYPGPDAIEQLRDTAGGSAVEGEAVIQDLTVLEESASSARVKATLFMRVDLNNTGNFQEETDYPICELRFKDGMWRLFNVETE
jgi:hypothetical protein